MSTKRVMTAVDLGLGRFDLALALALTLALGSPACTKGGVSDRVGYASADAKGADVRVALDLPIVQFPDAGPAYDSAPPALNIETMRIEPADSTVTVAPGKSATVNFRTFATLKGSSTEIEITGRTVFYVPDNYLVGGFPADGSATFTTRVPATATDPPQRGGTLTVQAQAANTDEPVTTLTTTLTVKIADVIVPAAGSPAATPVIPADPASTFKGTEDATLAPTLVYPNDGVLLPPNVGSLEIHFMPGKAAGELYEISLQAAYTDIRIYTRCAADATQFVTGGCVHQLSPATINVIAETNRGGDPVKLTLRGTNGSGKFGQTGEASIQFAAERVDGAVYYWTASTPPRVMRFDFGSQSGLASVLQPSDLPSDNGTPGRNTRCVGCHTLSRDGGRMIAATGGSETAYLVYLNDLTLGRTAGSNWLTVDGRNNGPAYDNRALLTSFNPDASEFVAAPSRNDTAAPPKSLIFHDGVTGLRKGPPDGSLALEYTPSFPDWSPDGNAIAVTLIYGTNDQTIRLQEGGISVITRGAAGWELPPIDVVPHEAGKSRYNASFAPDSSILLYTESIRESGDTDRVVDGYSDPPAKIWAVIPEAGAQPVALDRANAPGVADTLTLADTRAAGLRQMLSAGRLMNTFPRWAPFAAKHDGRKLFWFTASSQRRAGLRSYYPNRSVIGDPDTQVLLWMFALDVDKVLAGEDGTYPGFFLPFQDMKTSNHMAQWAQKYISDKPPTPPTPVLPPPAPPPPPPVPIL